ncbi:hypothetical protein HON88_01365 [Candidatus Woesearchaeota archaeon]|nr:hypothetical protein [Candidatus Woesearchaeota archaeon]MBT6336469.1 hypothetical protein [Candidatus Woesearchaeota archaeon]
MMKKLYAIMILAVFLISLVPLSLAEETETMDDTVEDMVTEETNEDEVEDEGDEADDDESVAPVKDKSGKKGLSAWKQLEQDIRRYISQNEFNSLEDCVETVVKKFPNRPVFTKATAKHLCRIKMNKNKVSDGKPMLPAYDVKKIIRAVKERPELEKAVAEFTSSQKDIMSDKFSRARYKWCLENTDECKDVLEKLVKGVKKKVQEKRKVIKKDLKVSRERYLKAKEDYTKVSDELKERRVAFLEMKENKGLCKDPESEKCAEHNEKMLEKAKAWLVRSIDVLDKHLNKIQERVKSSEDLSEEDATKMLEDVEAGLKRLRTLREKAEAATTKEEVRAVAKEVKKFWSKYKVSSKGYAIHLAQGKVEDIIKKSYQLERKLEAILKGAELRGIEITEEVDSLVDEFSENTEEARAHYEKSREYLREAYALRKDGAAEDVDRVKELMEMSKEELKSAREAIQSAHKKLSEMMRVFKALMRSAGEDSKEVINEAVENEYDEEQAEEDAEDMMDNGVEEPLANCVDHDSDRDIFTASFVAGDSGYMVAEFNDFCSNHDAGIGTVEEGTYVHEYFCSDGFVVGQTYECDNGCSAGACIA